MPLYEYECRSCGHRFELIRKFSDSPVKECPSCGGAVRKLLSSPAIHFKGAGWYITDYARKGKTGAEASETSTKPTSDSKPAAEPATTASAATPASGSAKRS